MTQEEDKYKDRSPKRFQSIRDPLVAGCQSFDRIVPGRGIHREEP